jgi:hypothetical protein
MQLTISSDDRLEDVLRVLGALHQVDLSAEIRAVAAEAPAGAAADAQSDGDGYRTKTRHGKAY